MIGTPAYGGQVAVAYMRSVMALTEALAARGIGWTLKTLDQESLITRARNVVVAEFLGRTDCTHLLFVDADIGFPAEAIVRMLDYDQPVVGCAVPMKGIDWQRVQSAAATGADPHDLRRRSLRFALNLGDGRGPARQRRTVDRGFVEVSTVGTGIMLIRRDVFDRLREARPDLAYRNDIAGYDNAWSRGNFWLFFDTGKDEATGRYLSEDFQFCRMWREACGGRIHCLIDAEITHYGQIAYRGSFIGAAG